MGKHQKQRGARKSARRSRLFTWIAIAGVAGLIVYGVSQMSSIVYTDEDIKVVNFTGLDRARKNEVLEAANRARCTCGCGLGLAQCVSTDLTCPIRETNVDKIKGMVREALSAQPSS